MTDISENRYFKEHDIYKLFSISRAAKILGIGRDTLKKLIREGRIKSIRIGKRIKIPAIELFRFICSNKLSEPDYFPPTYPQATIRAKVNLIPKGGDNSLGGSEIIDSIIQRRNNGKNIQQK